MTTRCTQSSLATVLTRGPNVASFEELGRRFTVLVRAAAPGHEAKIGIKRLQEVLHFQLCVPLPGSLGVVRSPPSYTHPAFPRLKAPERMVELATRWTLLAHRATGKVGAKAFAAGDEVGVTSKASAGSSGWVCWCVMCREQECR